MRRATICLTVLLSMLLLGGSTSAMAFTFRLASVGQGSLLPVFPRVCRIDLTTPIFLRLVAHQRIATLALDRAYVRRGFSVLRTQLAMMPRPSQASHQTDTVLPRYVSGVETGLLRDAQSVVAKPQR